MVPIRNTRTIRAQYTESLGVVTPVSGCSPLLTLAKKLALLAKGGPGDTNSRKIVHRV